MILGRCSRARFRTRSMSMSSVSLSTSYPTKVNHLPEKFTGEPCVRCPPWASTMPRTFCSGFRGSRKAPYAAMLAWAPAWGWTLACSAPKSCLARWLASTSSTLRGFEDDLDETLAQHAQFPGGGPVRLQPQAKRICDVLVCELQVGLGPPNRVGLL